MVRSSVSRVIVVVILVVIVWVVAAVIIIGITRVVVRVRPVVIVRIVAGGVRIIIRWVESPPETVEEDKNAIVIKVGMPFVPIVMPIAIMSRKRVVP